MTSFERQILREFFSAKEVCNLIGRTRMTLLRYRREFKVPYYQGLGYRKKDIERLLTVLRDRSDECLQKKTGYWKAKQKKLKNASAASTRKGAGKRGSQTSPRY